MRTAYANERNRRLVFITRALVGTALVGLVTATPSLWMEGQSQVLGLASAAVLAVLVVAYGAVLLAARAGRWRLARLVLFGAWVIYPATLLLMWRPNVDPSSLNELVLVIGTAIEAVVLIGFVTLEVWGRARTWIGLSLAVYGAAGAFVGLIWAPRPDIFLSMALIATLLLGAMVLAGRVLLTDIEASLRDAEQRRQEAVGLQADMQLALQTARAANTAKSRFLANMSHELRTPLTAIIGYVELIQEGGSPDPAELQEDLTRVRGAAVHLLGVLNAILDLSKIEAGKIEVEMGDVDLLELLHDVTHTLEPLAVERGTRLGLRTMELPRTIRTDGQKLRQVLLNLLSNAVKFTEGGSVELRAEVAHASGDGAPTRLRIDVIDTGAGIPRDQLDRVFDAFERADHEITRRVGGTGLGLAISRRFCELMGGTLTARSRLGHGSTFTVKLPLP